MIKKLGNQYIVTDSSGEKILGKHESKKSAIKQLQAIETSQAKHESTDEGKILSFSEYISENA
jgi:hypothetical protein